MGKPRRNRGRPPGGLNPRGGRGAIVPGEPRTEMVGIRVTEREKARLKALPMSPHDVLMLGIRHAKNPRD